MCKNLQWKEEGIKSPETELQVVMGCLVGSEIQTQDFSKNN